MLKIGLTGGIGSGKTTVAKVFEVLGISVYYADDRAKQLMNGDAELKKQVKKHFGEGVYTGGELNRKILADMVFADPGKLQLLNSLVHPATLKDAEAWMQTQNTPYCIKEAALIFESGAIIITGAKNCLQIKCAYEFINTYLFSNYNKITQ